ncbi:hypothetical protein SY2F82_41550 [Streptomyces sp. Y2F8-2]|nr:hypothetical protein SY2F82_41550 [Streptomyces sp. Y2F8-2]
MCGRRRRPQPPRRPAQSSITTGNKTRDNHLRSADFLDVERYPYINFVSTRFGYRGGSKWTLHGTLTMHGISRSVSLDTTYLGTVNGGYDQELRCAALAKAELRREDFTLNWRSMPARGIAVVGPTVQLELDVQAMYRTPEPPRPRSRRHAGLPGFRRPGAPGRDAPG